MTKYFYFFISLIIVVFGSPNQQDNLPSPYCDLEEILPFDGHGWYSHSKQMSKLFNNHEIQVVIEVGSWLGASTRHMANLLKPGGKIYAVDHWLGSDEHQEGGSAYNPVLNQLYEQFLSNVVHAGLTEKIIPIRMDSLKAAAHLKGIVPDLVYIDGDHSTDGVYQDLVAWYPFVSGHGILCGDDWDWPSVAIAVKRFAQEHNLQIISKKSFWMYKENKR